MNLTHQHEVKIRNATNGAIRIQEQIRYIKTCLIRKFKINKDKSKIEKNYSIVLTH